MCYTEKTTKRKADGSDGKIPQSNLMYLFGKSVYLFFTFWYINHPVYYQTQIRWTATARAAARADSGHRVRANWNFSYFLFLISYEIETVRFCFPGLQMPGEQLPDEQLLEMTDAEKYSTKTLEKKMKEKEEEGNRPSGQWEPQWEPQWVPGTR